MSQSNFDCADPLRRWIDDPTKSVVDRMHSLIECYSEAYRRVVTEIVRLEHENADLKERLRRQTRPVDATDLQKIVDASISYLDNS